MGHSATEPILDWISSNNIRFEQNMRDGRYKNKGQYDNDISIADSLDWKNHFKIWGEVRDRDLIPDLQDSVDEVNDAYLIKLTDKISIADADILPKIVIDTDYEESTVKEIESKRTEALKVREAEVRIDVLEDEVREDILGATSPEELISIVVSAPEEVKKFARNQGRKQAKVLDFELPPGL